MVGNKADLQNGRIISHEAEVARYINNILIVQSGVDERGESISSCSSYTSSCRSTNLLYKSMSGDLEVVLQKQLI